MQPSPGIAIIKREFLSGLRNAKPFVFVGFVLLIMIVGLVFMIRESLETTLRYNGALSVRDVRALFMVFSMGLYFGAILLIPPMAGVSICIEKQQDSYDLLRMTYIRPASLAAAKLLNVLGIYGLVVIATLPILGVFFFLVGIDWTQLFLSSLVILTAALSCASIGLLCSAFFYRTLPAIITTFVLVFIFHGGFLLLLAIATELILIDTFLGRFIMDIIDQDYILALAPMISLVIIGEIFGSTFEVVLGIVYHLALFGGAMTLTLVVLNRPTRPMQVESERPIDSQAELKARRKKFPYYLLDPRRRRPQIPDHRNPMLAKERQTGLLGRVTFGVRVFYGLAILCLVISLFSIMENNYSMGDYGTFTALPLLIDTILVLVLAPALIATSMAKEHEWGNMDMLRMTLLEPRQIVYGKFASSVLTAALPVAGALLGSFPVLFFSYKSLFGWAGVLSGLGSMVVCVLYVLSLTLLVTTGCRKGLTALMLAYGACIFALVLVPMGLLFCMEVFRVPYERSLAGMIAATSPIIAQFFNLADLTDEDDGEYLVNAYWLVNLICFTALSAGFLLWAQARFRWQMRRGLE